MAPENIEQELKKLAKEGVETAEPTKSVEKAPVKTEPAVTPVKPAAEVPAVPAQPAPDAIDKEEPLADLDDDKELTEESDKEIEKSDDLTKTDAAPTKTEPVVTPVKPAAEVPAVPAQPVAASVPVSPEISSGEKTSGTAIAALILSVPLSLLGLVLGLAALSKIKKSPNLKGKGLAIAAIIIGSLLFLARVGFLIYAIFGPAPAL